MCLSLGGIITRGHTRIQTLPSQTGMPLAADRLEARGYHWATCLFLEQPLDPPAQHRCARPPGGPRLKPCLLRPRIRIDPRLTGDSPPLGRAFFMRLAMRFGSASSAFHPPMCEYYGDLVGDQSLYSVTGLAPWFIEGGPNYDLITLIRISIQHSLST